MYDLSKESRLSEQERRRHKRESNALRAISSPAIVRIVEDGVHLEEAHDRAGSLWTAFEFVEGRDLRYMMTLKPVQVSKIMTSISTMAEGIDLVHAAKVVHRDIKPENFILRGKRWNEPVLVDFGYARPFDASRLTRSGLQVGTRSYTAPEVQRGLKAEAGSDQWSFARLSAELLLWARGNDADDIRDSVGARDDILDRFSDCGSAAEVFGRALERDPEDRYDDVSDFSAALEEALYDDELIEREDAIGSFTGEHWDKRKPLNSYLQRLGFRVVDKRPLGGALWVIAGNEFEGVREYLLGREVAFQAGSGKATGHEPGYWTKHDG